MRDIEKGLFAKQFSKTCLSWRDCPLVVPSSTTSGHLPANLKAVLKNHLTWRKTGASLHSQGQRHREIALLRPKVKRKTFNLCLLFAIPFSKTCLSWRDCPLVVPSSTTSGHLPANLKAVLKNHLTWRKTGASLHSQDQPHREIALLRPFYPRAQKRGVFV